MRLEYLLPVVIIPWLVCFARLAVHWSRVDEFVKRLYDDHRDIWESLGKPCGCRWSASGRIATPFSIFSFRWAWLRQDPGWLERVPELRDRFQQMREGFREWNFRAMPIMIGSALLFALVVKVFETS